MILFMMSAISIFVAMGSFNQLIDTFLISLFFGLVFGAAGIGRFKVKQLNLYLSGTNRLYLLGKQDFLQQLWDLIRKKQGMYL